MEEVRDAAAWQRLLQQWREELEELEEEQMFTLSQTGLHVTGGTRRRFEAEIAAVREKIREAEEQLRRLA